MLLPCSRSEYSSRYKEALLLCLISIAQEKNRCKPNRRGCKFMTEILAGAVEDEERQQITGSPLSSNEIH